LLAVADGMGGHAAGEVASAAVIAALERLDELDADDPQAALREAVHDANGALRDMVAADNELHGMGTTVTAVLADGAYAWLAHVGDSRAYLLRDGTLVQLTHDHTYVQQLVDEGRISAQDASSHPQRNYITRAIDGRGDMEIDLERLDLLPGDRLLLCSDGLSGVVSDDTLQEVLKAGTPQETVDRLVALALRGGGPDNVTCIIADAIDANGATAHDDAAVLGADSTARKYDPMPVLIGSDLLSITERALFRHWHELDREGLKLLAQSISRIATMPESQRLTVLDQIDEIYETTARPPEPVRIPYVTRCYRTRLKERSL